MNGFDYLRGNTQAVRVPAYYRDSGIHIMNAKHLRRRYFNISATRGRLVVNPFPDGISLKGCIWAEVAL